MGSVYSGEGQHPLQTLLAVFYHQSNTKYIAHQKCVKYYCVTVSVLLLAFVMHTIVYLAQYIVMCLIFKFETSVNTKKNSLQFLQNYQVTGIVLHLFNLG